MPKKFRWSALPWLPLLLVTSSACTPPAPPASDSAAPAQEPDLPRLTAIFQARLDELHQQHGFIGATAAFILPDGEVGAAATGLADVERQIPMTVEHRMPAASIGKTFAAATALDMVADGLIGLDDPASKWLGDEAWFTRLANHDTMTLRHLLTHSSGLVDHVYDDDYRQASRQRRNSPDADPDAWFPPRELVAFILDKPALFDAGEGYAYTDTGYLVAGLMLEKASGAAYYDEAQRRLIDPLGLDRTEAQLGRSYDGLASGYLGGDTSWGLPEKMADEGSLVFNPRSEWTGGGYVSNPQDLVRWAKALYEGEALQSDYLGPMFESGYRGDDAHDIYGLGVFLVDNELGHLVGHGGLFPGWRSSMYYHPQKRVAVALQINQFEPDMHNVLRQELFATLLAALE
jgi:D-alanyl-D-alanine carboxypeptidase